MWSFRHYCQNSTLCSSSRNLERLLWEPRLFWELLCGAVSCRTFGVGVPVHRAGLEGPHDPSPSSLRETLAPIEVTSGIWVHGGCNGVCSVGAEGRGQRSQQGDAEQAEDGNCERHLGPMLVGSARGFTKGPQCEEIPCMIAYSSKSRIPVAPRMYLRKPSPLSQKEVKLTPA